MYCRYILTEDFLKFIQFWLSISSPNFDSSYSARSTSPGNGHFRSKNRLYLYTSAILCTYVTNYILSIYSHLPNKRACPFISQKNLIPPALICLTPLLDLQKTRTLLVCKNLHVFHSLNVK